MAGRPRTTKVSQSAGLLELGLLGGVLAAAFSIASLAGWSVFDPSWLEPGSGTVSNWCGPVGAFVADCLFLLLGYGAWAIVLPGIWCGQVLAGKFRLDLLRWIAGVVAYLIMLAALHLLWPFEAQIDPGGVMGSWIADAMTTMIGPVGALLLLAGAAIASSGVLLDFRWREVFTKILDGWENYSPDVREHFRQGIWGIVRYMSRGAFGLWGLFYKAASRRMARVSQRVLGITGRIRDSFTRVEDNEFAFAGSVSILPDEETEVPPNEFARVGALAEVEWDRTDPSGGRQPPTTPGVAIVRPSTPATKSGQEKRMVFEDQDEDLPSDPSSEVLALFPDLTPRSSKTSTDFTSANGRKTKPTGLVSDEAPGVIVHTNRRLHERPSDDGGAVAQPTKTPFQLPMLSLLDEVPEQRAIQDDDGLRKQAAVIEEKLQSFRVGGRITAVRPGPVVTIFEFRPDAGVKVARIKELADDLKMALSSASVRIVAPIPGKDVVGIEVPSPKRMTIFLRTLLASPEFRDNHQALPIILGKDVEGRPTVADLTKMPHLLIGGTTGSGKSVGINGLLLSLLFTRTPSELRLLLVDPKKLEFEPYAGIPHLLYPVITEPKEANAALAWACKEMDARYEMLARFGVRSIAGYNEKIEQELPEWTAEKARRYAPKGWTELDGPLKLPEKLPYIVVVVDELADLMMVSGNEVEESLVRIAQKARACGIHLIVATQRPSTDVVTGLLKANLPSRISFKLRTKLDSRVILDENGAETLLGAGDMLYIPNSGALMRAHGAWVTDAEVYRITDFLRAQGEPEFVQEVVAGGTGAAIEMDERLEQAIRICLQSGKASTSLVQRHLKIGYNTAANLVDQMEALGVVGPADGARPREMRMSAGEIEDLLGQ